SGIDERVIGTHAVVNHDTAPGSHPQAACTRKFVTRTDASRYDKHPHVQPCAIAEYQTLEPAIALDGLRILSGMDMKAKLLQFHFKNGRPREIGRASCRERVS